MTLEEKLKAIESRSINHPNTVDLVTVCMALRIAIEQRNVMYESYCKNYSWLKEQDLELKDDAELLALLDGK